MPIKGLTDRGLAFPEIGQIRKGSKKEPDRPGKELPHFRVEFGEGDPAAGLFLKHYGAAPTVINVILPFNEVERNWEAWLEAYTAGRMIARSDGDTMQYWVDVAKGEVKVLHGLDVTTNQPVRHTTDLGVYKTGSGATKKIEYDTVGRLKVVIPVLGRMAYLTVHTTSIYDIQNISGQLEALRQMNRGRLAGIPLLLKRVPKYISVPNKDGTRARRLKHMISIEADPEWVRRMLVQMNQLALPGEIKLALPGVAEQEARNINEEGEDMPEEPDPDETGEKDVVTGKIVDAPPDLQDEPEQPGLPLAPEPVRPYEPSVMQQKFLALVESLKANEVKVDVGKSKVIHQVLIGLAGGDIGVVAKVLSGLTGKMKFDQLEPVEVEALWSWLSITADKGGEYRSSVNAAKEFQMIARM